MDINVVRYEDSSVAENYRVRYIKQKTSEAIENIAPMWKQANLLREDPSSIIFTIIDKIRANCNDAISNGIPVSEFNPLEKLDD